MENSRNFFRVSRGISSNLIIIIVGLAILIIGGVLFLQKSPQQQRVLPTPTPIATTAPSPTETSEDIIKELTPELNPDNNPNFVATIDIREGNYIRGGAGFGGGGYGWYAVKQSGKWKIVEKTQNAPSCSIMQKYNFPESIYQDCRPE